MKKIARFAAASLAVIFIVSISLLLLFGMWAHHNNQTIETYNRFHKIVDHKKVFNWWGFISPTQVETQAMVHDTVFFTKKVVYPVSPQFDLVSPSDSNAEAVVAQTIAQTIADTIHKIKFNLQWDYDGQARAVRDAVHPPTLQMQSPKVILSLVGTASPESQKDGFWKSIQPGQLEPENAVLAKARLDRTAPLVLSNLHRLGVDSIRIDGLESTELQFSETDSPEDSLTAVVMLDSMRYVEAFVWIPVQRLEITPVTSPVGLPFVVIFACVLVAFIWAFICFDFSFVPGLIWEALKLYALLILVTIACIALGYFLWSIRMILWYMLIGIATILAIFILVWIVGYTVWYIRNIDWEHFFDLLGLAMFLLFHFLCLLVERCIQFVKWVCSKPGYILVVHLVFDALVILAYKLGWLHIFWTH